MNGVCPNVFRLKAFYPKALKWSCAIVVSLLVHVAAAGIYSYQAQPEQGYSLGEGEGGVEVGLGQAGSYVHSAAEPEPQKTPDSEPVANPEPPVEKAESKSAPKPVKKPEPAKIQVETPVKATVKTVQAEHAKHSLAVEKPATPVEDESEKSDVTPQKEAELDQAKTDLKSGRENTTASVRATGRAKGAKSGARKGDSRHYFGEVTAWLNQHKRYPVELKKKKKQGVVVVQFTVNRDGVVTASSIKKSSGILQLDTAALQMLSDASPLPAIPDWMGRQTLTLALPVEYSLITNTVFKE